MNSLIIIPARGGSKGIPGKNIKLLNGKPLIQYTIEAAQEIFPNDSICVSTDSHEIKSCVQKIGLDVPFMRPLELSTDEAGSFEVLLHALRFYNKKGYNPETIILLQPTSPLRTSYHIKEAIKLYESYSDIDMLVSVCETKSNPYFSLFEENSNGLLIKSKESNFIRRQDCPKVWEYNGAIYIISVDSLKIYSSLAFPNVKKYVMTETESVDIDSEMDFYLAELIMKNVNKGNL
jgi:N-acylneuraminate cytidylyltransferase